MFCDSCGAVNREGASFCRGCGAPLAAVASTDTTVTTPPPPSVSAALREALAGEYEVDALLGKGGMGAVYRGRELALDREVAIKVLPSEVAADRAAVERFLREARLAARLRHPNIVAIHAVGERSGVHFFTMDLIDGESLATLVAKRQGTGAPPLQEARAIVAAIAAAVAHAHRNGVVHRDLKPSNVMVQRDGHVVVLDFGLARAEGSSDLTASGAVVGTPRYMSPEQAEGKPATPASDIYSLGLVYFFVLAGRDLVSGDSVGAIVGQHLTADLRSAVRREGRVPAEDAAWIVRMVERDPSRRLTSLDELLAGLRGAPPIGEGLEPTLAPAASMPSPPPLSPTPRPPTPSPARRKARERLKGLLDRLERGDEDET